MAKKKISRRRKKEEVSPIEKETVEIERNPIEKAILYLQRWIQYRKSLILKLSIAGISLILLILGFLLIQHLREEEYQKRFYILLEKYQSLKGIPEKEKIKPTLEKLSQESSSICFSFFPPAAGYSHCLLSSILFLEQNQLEKAEETLKRYFDNQSDPITSSFVKYTLLSLLEERGKLQEIKKLLEEEETALSLYYQAQIHLKEGSKEKSIDLLKTLLKKYPTSPLSTQARALLLQISLLP